VPFAHNNFGGLVPAAGQRDDRDLALLDLRAVAGAKVGERIEDFHFKAALHEVMELARAANAYLAEKAPWKQRKTDVAAAGTTVNVGLQVVRTLTTLMAPFLPFSAAKCAAMLRLPPGWEAWSGAGDELPDGAALGEATPLFRKLTPYGGAPS
jgi:methionyl-tRNA synthetase